MRLFLFLKICFVDCVILPKAILYGSNGCRACLRFEKKFKSLEETHAGISFEKINISESSENKKNAFENKVSKIPVVLFKVNDEERARYTGVPSKYELIDKTCRDLDLLPSNVNEFDPIIFRCAKLCQKVYSDSYLRSCEEFVENKDTDCQVSITRDSSRVFVVFRGSDSFKDWKMNFKSSLVSYPSGSDRKVHAGFLVQWLSVKAELLSKIEKILKRDRYMDEVIFCGHSAGVVCCLAAEEFTKVNKNPKRNVEVVTFGSPRVCNQAYKDYFEQKLKCTRLVLDRDIVARLPLRAMGYRHIGRAMQMRENIILERDTDSLETLWWIFLGLFDADIGIRDHMIDKYIESIKQY